MALHSGNGRGPGHRVRVPGGGSAALVLLPLNSTYKEDGDSFDAQNDLGHEWFWTALLLNGRLRPMAGWQGGVGGQRTDQVYDGRAATLSPVSDVVVLLDGTNDVVQSVPAATIVNGPKGDAAYVAAAAAAGAKRVFLRSIPAAPNATQIGTGAKETNRQAANALRSALASPAVIVSPGTQITSDAQLADTLHFLPKTAYAAAKVHAAAMSPHIEAGDVLGTAPPAGDLLGGWSLAGTTGSKFNGPIGEVATGWAVGGDQVGLGAGVVCSKTTLRGYTAQRIQISGTATGPSIINLFRQPARSFTAGEIYDAMVDCQFGPNPSGILGVGLYLIKYDGQQELGRWGTANIDYGDPVLWGADTVNGVMRGVPTAVAATGSTNGMGLEIRIGVKAGTVLGDFTFARPSVRLVS